MKHALALVLAVSAPGQAQQASSAQLSPRAAACASCAARADSVFFHGDAVGSLEIARSGLAQDSTDVGLLSRAARSEIALGILDTSRAGSDAHYVRAIVVARRAVAYAPGEADTHYWLAAALGRRALKAGFRVALPLASETYHEASRALALDSLHAGAHDVMGKLHSEVRKLPWMVRRLIAILTSLDVARIATWESAEAHLKRAIALDPTLMIARVDLSQLYLRTGRRAEAVALVEELERMPRRTPVDGFLQVEARQRLGWYP